MIFKRASGIILHPTSLPGPYGNGDVGPEAFRWVDFLAKAGSTLWQVLPLGPTAYGDSPYQCFSAFAGNPYLISPDRLLEDGLLMPEDLANRPEFHAGQVDYGAVIPWKLALLDRAYARFEAQAPASLAAEFRAFQDAQSAWLDDFALFMALKDAHNGAPWVTWEPALRSREPGAIEQARRDFAAAAGRQSFRQFLFFRQWAALHDYARRKGVSIIGDAPIFVAHDSADVWAYPELFYLDPDGQPTVVAGVPPDYFSPTGQLWGNPLYRWEAHAAGNYAWWLGRLRALLQLVDIVRLDHFRGFAGYWEVPAGETTAKNGRWTPGPGASFFSAVEQALGELPVIAEDLGEITPDVIELRERFNLPGMKVLQFAFNKDPDDKYLPHNFPANCVVYTGTHDNDTTLGWYQSTSEAQRDFCRRYMGRSGSDICWDMIRLAWSSVAVLALAPLQDFLCLGTEARMNLPGRPSGNWAWRMPEEALSEGLRLGLSEFNFLYSRAPSPDSDIPVRD